MIHRMLFVWLCLFLIGTPTLAIRSYKSNAVAIDTAINRGWVKATFSGAYDPRYTYEAIDPNGTHYGKCIMGLFEAIKDTSFIIEIGAGRLLFSSDSSVQNMLITHSVFVPIQPGPPLPVLLYAMCAEIHDSAPTIYTQYVLDGLADSGSVKLAEYIEKNDLQNRSAQHAVWAWANGATREELIKYGADSASLERTINILDANALKTEINKPIEAVDEKKLPVEDAGATVTIPVLYLVGCLVVLILCMGFFIWQLSRQVAN